MSADDHLQRQAIQSADQLLEALSGHNHLILKVRQILLAGLNTGKISLEQTAQQLSCSARSLQRQLEAQKASFRTLLDDVRCAQAKHYLQQTDISLVDIAFLLGYTEQSTFNDAFRRWTGQTPRQFRLTH